MLNVLHGLLQRVTLVVFLSGFFVHAHAAPTDISRGLAWLQGQVSPDGQIAQESGTASLQQVRCETGATLFKLASGDPKTVALINSLHQSGAEISTQSLACEQQLRQQIGQSAPAPEVERRHVAGLAYAAFEDYTVSSSLDSGWVLSAQLQNLTSADKALLLAWLQANQGSDGSFATNGTPDVLATAAVLRGLKDAASQNAAAAAIATKAATYLLGRRNAVSQWNDDVASTAMVFEAVQPYTGTDPSIATGVASYLLSKQLPDGSWSDDTYLTAVALRALGLTAQPALDPNQSGLTVKFVDARNNVALPGVLLTALNSGAVNGTSDAQGAITLNGLTADTYQLRANLAGYATLNFTVTLKAGQVLDVGVLQMIVPTNPNLAVVTGQVRDQSSNQPVAGVTVTVAPQNVSAVTTADGRYLISTVAPASVTFSTAKTGYASAAGSATVLAGQVFNFSPMLTPIAAPGTPGDCAVQGLVIDAVSHLPLAGVAVNLGGVVTQSAVTDATGHYVLSGLLSGTVTLGTVKTGYDPVNAATRAVCDPVRVTVLDFSPHLYATGQTPPNANTTGLSGVVLDARTNQAISNATIVAIPDVGLPVNAVSAADGTFRIIGLGGASAQLNVTATGYQGSNVQYALNLLAVTDIGQIRLRPPKVDQLLPDFKVIAVRHSNAHTDPQTLQLTGTVDVDITNVGTQIAPAGVAVLAFGDVNLNSAYDAGTDVVLGQTTLATVLTPGQTTTVHITVSGTQLFRDAPISVIVDPTQQIPEITKTNNVRSSAQDALFTPTSTAFNPVLKWEWHGSANYPTSYQVMMSPVVGPCRDTNDDGKIDSRDTPCVIFITFAGNDYGGNGVIRVLDGATGHELLSIFDGTDGVSAASGLVLADIDGDGKPEIIALTPHSRVIAFRNDGTKMWASAIIGSGNGESVQAVLSVADLEGNGKPAIITGKAVINADGTTRWIGAGRNNGGNFPPMPMNHASVVSDLFDSGQQNVIVGATVYSATGQLLWEVPEDGLSAVADFEGNGQPSIVVVSNSFVSLYSRDGVRKWRVAVPGGVWGGPPTIADVDGDGIPEIGVAGGNFYTVYRADGSVMWSQASYDPSGQTGSTFFDFFGMGAPTALYFDELKMRAFNGATGTVLWNIPNSSGTLMEYPLVVDVDNGGHADLVVASNNYYHNETTGVRVFQDANNGWAPTRNIWNQHAYSITNINDDLSVPRHPVPSWKANNTFRLNQRTEAPVRAIADLTVGYLRIADAGAAGGSTLMVRLGNAGSFKVPQGTSVAVYNTDPALGQPASAARLAFASTTQDLQPGQWQDLVIPVAGNLATLSANKTIWIVGDDDGTGKTSIADVDRSNNTLAGDLSAIALNLHIAVSTDKASYSANDQAVFSGVVSNQGSFAHDALVRYTVLDAQAQNVVVLPLGSPVAVPAGANATVPVLWSVAGIQAGNYQVKAELVTPLGVVYGSATAAFTIQAGQGQANSARITADRASYTAAQSVELTAQVSNLTANSAQSNLVARTTVLGSGAQTVFNQSEAIAQLAAGAQRQYSYSVAASGLTAGNYTAQLQLLDAQNAVLAQSSSSFSVTSSVQSGVGVNGTLQATPASVTVGQNVVLALSATNNGNAALLNAPITVKVIDPIAGTVLATFTNSSNLLPSWGVGATQNLQWTWVASGPTGQTVLASASVQVGGNTVALGQANINVLQPTGPALVGSIAATPSPAVAGSTVTINASALNQGAVDLSNVPLTVTLTNTSTHAVVATWPFTANIAKGKSFAMLSSWQATGSAPSNSYIAMLNATVAGQPVTLATANLVVTVPPVKLTVTQTALRQGRMLVLLTCRNGEDHYSDQHGNDVRNNGRGDDDDHCNSSRATYLNTLLGSAGIPHLVTSDVDDFVNALRSGQYNIYWLAGGADKLGNELAAELREAINRGDGLLLDGIHDDCDNLLDEVVGLQYRGQLEAVNQPILFTMAPLTGKTLQTTGRSNKLKLGNGALVAKFPAGLACHDCDDDDDRHGTSKTDNTAIAGYVYGKGKGVVFAFDLIGSIQNHSNDPNWITAIQLAYDFLTPDVPASGTSGAAFTSGAYTALRTNIVNAGSTVDLNITQKLPVGAKALSGDPAVTLSNNGQQAQWSVNLSAGQSKDLTLYLRLPTVSSAYSTDTTVSNLLDGQSNLYGEYFLPLQVTSATEAAATTKLIADLKALSLGSNHDRQMRDQAVKAMQDASSQNNPDSSIRYLLDALGKLSAITTTDVSAYRLRVDVWMQELAYKWQAAQPVKPAH